MGIDGHCAKSEIRFENSRLWWSNCIASQIYTGLFMLRRVALEASYFDMRHAAFLFYIMGEFFSSIWADFLTSY